MNKTSATPNPRPTPPSTRLRLIAVAGLIVLAIGFVVFAILQSARPPAPAAVTVLPGLANGQALGPASARVTIQEFADFQCPYCLQFHNTIEGPLVQQYVNTGQVRFEYHHFIIIDSHTGGHESERAAEASECANAQGKFWAYHDALFAHQAGEGSGAFSDDNLLAFAQTLGLDMPTFSQCLASGRYAAAVQLDMNKGLALGVQGTPTLFINGVQVQNPFDFASLQAMIKADLAASS